MARAKTSRKKPVATKSKSVSSTKKLVSKTISIDVKSKKFKVTGQTYRQSISMIVEVVDAQTKKAFGVKKPFKIFDWGGGKDDLLVVEARSDYMEILETTLREKGIPFSRVTGIEIDTF